MPASATRLFPSRRGRDLSHFSRSDGERNGLGEIAAAAPLPKRAFLPPCNRSPGAPPPRHLFLSLSSSFFQLASLVSSHLQIWEFIEPFDGQTDGRNVSLENFSQIKQTRQQKWTLLSAVEPQKQARHCLSASAREAATQPKKVWANSSYCRTFILKACFLMDSYADVVCVCWVWEK